MKAVLTCFSLESGPYYRRLTHNTGYENSIVARTIQHQCVSRKKTFKNQSLKNTCYRLLN